MFSIKYLQVIASAADLSEWRLQRAFMHDIACQLLVSLGSPCGLRALTPDLLELLGCLREWSACR